MLPSAGQSHSALGVPAPVVYCCTPVQQWWLSSLMDCPNILGFPTMDSPNISGFLTMYVHVLSQQELWDEFSSAPDLIPSSPYPQDLQSAPWECHQESPGSLTAPLHTWEMKDVTDLKTCSWLPNPRCPSNGTTVTFSLSFTRKSCGIGNVMLLPSGEDWKGVKTGRASAMASPDLQHGGSQRASSIQKMSIITFLGATASQKSSTTFIYDTTLVPMASH